jgi:hypothetical protein
MVAWFVLWNSGHRPEVCPFLKRETPKHNKVLKAVY